MKTSIRLSFIACVFMILNFSASPSGQSRILEIGGPLKARLDLSVRRLLSDEPFGCELVVEDVVRNRNYSRRFEEWEGDISGRYLSALSAVSLLTGRHFTKLDSIAESVLRCQTDEGYFGQNREPEGPAAWGQMMWGHGRLLTGLTEYARLTEDPRFIQAAVDLGNYLLKSIERWDADTKSDSWFTNYISIFEGVMHLYNLTGETRFLTGAGKIIPFIMEFGHYHSHGYLMGLLGLGEYSRAARDEAALEKLVRVYWQDVRRRGFVADGSVPEYFPQYHRSEGCSIVDWMDLNLLLWRLTGETIYLDEAERTMYNGLFFNQTHQGMFGHPLYANNGYAGAFSESWWCCIFHGVWGMTKFAETIAACGENGISVNFFVPSVSEFDIRSGKVRLEMKTRFPSEGEVSIGLALDSPAFFPLRIRVPSWSDMISFRINGEHVAGSREGGYYTVARVWKNGDQADFTLPFSLRLENTAGIDMLKDMHGMEGRSQLAVKNAAIYYGPLMMVADARNSPFAEIITLTSLEDLRVEATPDPTYYNSEFYVRNVGFYADKKFTNGMDTIYLTPLSEQTGHFPYTEKISNFMPDGEIPIERYPVQFLFDVRIEKRNHK